MNENNARKVLDDTARMGKNDTALHKAAGGLLRGNVQTSNALLRLFKRVGGTKPRRHFALH